MVLMTPVGMSGDEAKMKLLGWFDGYLSKPVRKAELLETVVRLRLAQSADAADWAGELEELPTQQTASGTARVTGSYRVLAAEDHDVNRRLLMTILGKLGHEVVVAEDGQQALDAGLEGEFDVILLDIQMPHLNGYQVSERLRAQGVETPIVALTAHAMQAERDRCLAAGMNDFLPKPFNTDALVPVLARWLPEVPADRQPRSLPTRGQAGAVLGPSADPVHRTLDWDGAVARFEGDAETVRSLLDSFGAKTGGQITDLVPALGEAAYDRMREIAHSIKGSARSLSAEQLGEAAARLEEAAGDAAEGTAPSETETSELRELVAALSGAFEQFQRAVAGLD